MNIYDTYYRSTYLYSISLERCMQRVRILIVLHTGVPHNTITMYVIIATGTTTTTVLLPVVEYRTGVPVPVLLYRHCTVPTPIERGRT